MPPRTLNRRKSEPVVVIAGDATVYWHIASAPARSPEISDSARLFRAPGGAALLTELARVTLSGPRLASRHRVQLHGLPPVASDLSPPETDVPRAHALWEPHRHREGPAVWRVSRFLGMDRRSASGAARAGGSASGPVRADIVVLDDHGLGFAERRDSWPRALEGKARPWVVWAPHDPVGGGARWRSIPKAHGARLITVVTTDLLRLAGARVSRGLSWEHTAEDLTWSLNHDDRLEALAQCAHVIVMIGIDGALLFSRPSRASRNPGRELRRLFFDASALEGEWAQRDSAAMPGTRACMLASVVRQLGRELDSPDLGLAIQRGLAAQRTLHNIGWGDATRPLDHVTPGFPFEPIAAELARDERPFKETAVPDPIRRAATDRGDESSAGPWSILGEQGGGAFHALAEQIVREGPELALSGAPVNRFGKLLIADRMEIEAYRELQHRLLQYVGSRGDRPFSIAVFGAPGSGKSFGVRELATAVLPGQIERLEYNLAQLADPRALTEALHRVRDIVVAQRIPLVFWDEFDVELSGRPLGWLAHLLGPMQDGTFQDGNATHRVGRAVFVFAGGTSATWEGFRERTKQPAMKRVKAPDFEGRIDAHLDVSGPNPRADWPGADPSYIVRRAILLRSLLVQQFPRLLSRRGGMDHLDIHSGVLHALLNIRRYRHGARSMEKLIGACDLAGAARFEPAALPSERVLDDFVSAVEFMALLEPPEFRGPILERMAKGLHDRFVARLRVQGYRRGSRTSEQAKTHSSLVEYARLPRHEKEQNRDNARSIPQKLAAIACVPVSFRGSDPLFEFRRPEVEFLAEMEHERWNQLKLMSGWRWGRETDKAALVHRDLRPWRPLTTAERLRRYGAEAAARLGPGGISETAREKDRALVRDIVPVLASIGYTIRRLEESSDGRAHFPTARPRSRAHRGRRTPRPR